MHSSAEVDVQDGLRGACSTQRGAPCMGNEVVPRWVCAQLMRPIPIPALSIHDAQPLLQQMVSCLCFTIGCKQAHAEWAWRWDELTYLDMRLGQW